MNEKINKILQWLKTDGTVYINDIDTLEKYIIEKELLIDKMKRFILNKGLMCEFLEEKNK